MHQSSSRPGAAPQVQPVIAEILRTCVHPPIVTLRVEHISRQTHTEESDSENDARIKTVTKLFLTDGELLIQGLLHRKLNTLPEIEDLKSGDVVEIHTFVVKKARRKNNRGHVVYLGIEDCYVIKSEDTPRKERPMSNIQSRISRAVKQDFHEIGEETNYHDDMAGGFLRSGLPIKRVHEDLDSDDHGNENMADEPTLERSNAAEHGALNHATLQAPTRRKDQVISPSNPHQISGKKRRRIELHSESEDDAFETIHVDLGTARKRRQALRDLSQNIASSPFRLMGEETKPSAHESTPLINGPRFNEAIVKFDLSKDDGRKATTNGVPISVHFPAQPTANIIESVHHVEKLQASDHKSVSFLRPHNPMHDTSQGSIPQPQPLSTPSQVWPYHSLASLHAPGLPNKSYTFTTLAIPTYVSSHLISRPGSAFPPKRHVKVIDPSLAAKLGLDESQLLGKGLTVSVYRNAVNFKPIIGKVALMQGVVMQKINGAMKHSKTSGHSEVILNIYPGKPRIPRSTQSQHGGNERHRAQAEGESQMNGSKRDSRTVITAETDAMGARSQLPSSETMHDRWFIDDHAFLRQQGYGVDAMQEWWEESLKSKLR